MISVYADLKKNTTGQLVYCAILDQYGAPISDNTYTFGCAVSKDGSAFANCNSYTSFLQVAKGSLGSSPGLYAFSPAAGDVNATFGCVYVYSTYNDGVHIPQPLFIYFRTSLKDFTPVAHSGLLQAVDPSFKSVTLAPTASSVTDFYKGMTLQIPGGNGQGQTAKITAYNPTTKVATISANSDQPSATAFGIYQATVNALCAIGAITGAPGFGGSDTSKLDALNNSILAVLNAPGLPTNGTDGAPQAGDAYTITDGN